jgi:hypothetical protein
MLQTLVQDLLPAFEALAAAVGLLLLTAARNWIAAHAKNAMVAGILDRLTDAVAVVVREAEQTLVAELKSGGKTMTGVTALAVRDHVVENLKSHLGPKGLKELEKVFDPAELDKVLVARVEAEVNDIRKAEGSSIAAAVMTTEPAS